MKHTKEQTLIIIKPDGIQRGLIGEVLKRIERVGLKLVALKFEIPDREKVRSHYTIDPNWIIKAGTKAYEARKKAGEDISVGNPEELGLTILSQLQTYMTSGPVVIMVWQGAHAVDVTRKLVGTTEPRTSDVGTIRGDYVHDSYVLSNVEKRAVRNVVHASGTPEEAHAEIQNWFDASEIIDYRLIAEEVMYDVNMDGVKE